jgi:hypothetical protein
VLVNQISLTNVKILPKMNRLLLLLGALLWINAANGQISTADSLAFAGQAKTWSALPALDSLPEWQINTLAVEWSDRTWRWILFFKHQRDSVVYEREAAEEALALAKADTSTSKETVKALQASLKKWRNAEKQQDQIKKQTLATINFSDEIPGLPLAKRRKALLQLERKVQELAALAAAQSPTPQVTPPPTAAADSSGTEGNTKPGRKSRASKNKKEDTEQPPAPTANVVADSSGVATASTTPDTTKSGGKLRLPKVKKDKAPAGPTATPVARYDPAKDVLLNPPVPPCSLAVERKDEFTGSVYRECQRHELLRYTNPVMKKVLPEGQVHIVCLAALATDGNNGGTLILTFQIQDPNARRTFGNLPKNGIAALKFMDGEMFTLFNSRAEDGQFDLDSGLAVYRASYPFEKTLLKKLEKTELDQVRIQWSTGYEDYGVQQVDQLQRQAGCLK